MNEADPLKRMVQLPAAEGIMRRLVETKDIKNFESSLYPLIADRMASKLVDVRGFLLLLNDALQAYRKGGIPPLAADLVLDEIPDLIRALIWYDRQVAEAAVEQYYLALATIEGDNSAN